MSYPKSIIVIIILSLTNCTPKEAPQRICLDKNIINCKKVPFDSLMKAPKEFQDNCIELEGYLIYKFERVALLKLKNMSLRDGAVWLNIVDTIGKQIEEKFPNGIRGKISVKGIFNCNENEIREGYIGELKSVTCLEIK
jgi:hypothetical protein